MANNGITYPLAGFKGAQDAPFQGLIGTATANIDLTDSPAANGYHRTQLDAQSFNELDQEFYDADNQLRLGNAVKTPVRESVTVHLYPNANLVTQAIFTNPTPRQVYITDIRAVWTTAGSVAGAAAGITHEAAVGGLIQAAGTGKAVLTANFDLHGTAATTGTGTLAAPYVKSSRNNSVTSSTPGSALIVLKPGESLSVKFAGTLTTLVGVTITINLAPGSKYHFVSYYLATAGTAQVTTSLMIAMRPRQLLYGAALWQVAETASGTATLDVVKDPSGTAPGAGTSCLSATASLKGTALTYTQLSLSATAANALFAPTDSASVKIGGSATLSALAGLLVTLAFAGNDNEVQIDYNGLNSTLGTNEEFFVADRNYQVVDIAGKWSAVAGSGGRLAVTSETGTNTPSSGGVVLVTDNSNAGFDTTGTINTPNFSTLAALHTLFLSKGDRLGLKNAGTVSTFAGSQVSIRLLAV